MMKFHIPALALLISCGSLIAQERYTDPEYTAEERSHWAFVAPKRPPVPSNKYSNTIDAFVVKTLQDRKWKLSPLADRRALIRRVTLDLTGLPPSATEVDNFLHDQTANAYEKVVDRLLASPHYGERAAQHWLDVVRYAETNGYELDAERPHAWRYRDYVTQAFNNDMPYDQFITEQIAGDELASGKDAKTVASLYIATGMHRCGPVHVVSGNLDLNVVRQEILTEMVNGVSSTVMGLTMGCARCHDHKFDPISLGDYYRMQSFFGSTRYAEVDTSSEAEQKAVKIAIDALKVKITPLKKQIEKIDAPYKARVLAEKKTNLDAESRAALDTPADKRTAEQKKVVKELGGALTIRWDDVLAIITPEDKAKRDALRAKIFELERTRPEPAPAAWAIEGDNKPAKTFILKRGDVNRKADEAKPEFPRVFGSAISQPKTRTNLAMWLTSPSHPLTARVIVNRLWQQHFGRGIVATPNDFGTRGEKPTHPELLDWLAVELMQPSEKKTKAWTLKRMHKLMVTSATYQQASATPPKTDGNNLYLSVFTRRRLDAETLRDSTLAVAGTLNRAIGGPSVRVPLEPEVYDLIFTEDEPDYLWLETLDVKQHTRRSLYLFAKRNVKLPMLEAFDQPDTLNSCATRPVSTFAPQALIMMNGPFLRDQAGALAVAILKEGDKDSAIDRAYSTIFTRKPTDVERKLGEQFLKAQIELVNEQLREKKPVGLPSNLPAKIDKALTRAMADYCLALLNTNEFVFIP